MAVTHHVSELLTKTEKKAQSEEVAPENPVWNDKDKQPWVGRIWEHFVARLEPVCWHQNGCLWSDDPYHTEQEGLVKALPGGQTLSQGVETSAHSLNQHLVRETTSMDQQAGGLHLCLANYRCSQCRPLYYTPKFLSTPKLQRFCPLIPSRTEVNKDTIPLLSVQCFNAGRSYTGEKRI